MIDDQNYERVKDVFDHLFETEKSSEVNRARLTHAINAPVEYGEKCVCSETGGNSRAVGRKSLRDKSGATVMVSDRTIAAYLEFGEVVFMTPSRGCVSGCINPYHGVPLGVNSRVAMTRVGSRGVKSVVNEYAPATKEWLTANFVPNNEKWVRGLIYHLLRHHQGHYVPTNEKMTGAYGGKIAKLMRGSEDNKVIVGGAREISLRSLLYYCMFGDLPKEDKSDSHCPDACCNPFHLRVAEKKLATMEYEFHVNQFGGTVVGGKYQPYIRWDSVGANTDLTVWKVG